MIIGGNQILIAFPMHLNGDVETDLIPFPDIPHPQKLEAGLHIILVIVIGMPAQKNYVVIFLHDRKNLFFLQQICLAEPDAALRECRLKFFFLLRTRIDNQHIIHVQRQCLQDRRQHLIRSDDAYLLIPPHVIIALFICDRRVRFRKRHNLIIMMFRRKIDDPIALLKHRIA